AGRGAGSLEMRYGAAFAAFRDQRYDEAEATAMELLKLDPEPKLEADVHYLLGLIHTNISELEVAGQHLHLALDIYQRLGRPESEGTTFLALARIALDDKDLEMARTFLEQAEVRHLSSSLQLWWYSLESRRAFLEGDYKEALEF